MEMNGHICTAFKHLTRKYNSYVHCWSHITKSC
ncbi:hypothetical protein EFL64_10995 [Weissella cibaria]|nr:hypothetical protein [Weissella cibaria]MCT8397853.1 hypothetical protein [Weissella confusa]MCS8565369.1 hypothetical protein [Weissella cibaria]MCS8577297.1 hypothetical protein [Weissella cibaria]MCT0958305.1 hypothetical protein [Weissella cibaria]